MNDLTKQIKEELLYKGADLVGVGNLCELPEDVRYGMPFGICVAVKYPKEVIRGISNLPTKEYCDWYNRLNAKLDMLVFTGAEFLQKLGYGAYAQTREKVGYGEMDNNTMLPHKTIATRAGIGWIGKSSLLVTEKYGSMVRLSSILTNAPLEAGSEINTSKCGGCTICRDACPVGVISGKIWEIGTDRDELFDPDKCRKAARERALQGFGGKDITICGKCIEICPYTKNYLNGQENN